MTGIWSTTFNCYQTTGCCPFATFLRPPLPSWYPQCTMTPEHKNDGIVAELRTVVIPNVTVKELLGVIPSHCFERSTTKSFLYLIWNIFIISCIYKTTILLDSEVVYPVASDLNYPYTYRFIQFALWSIYGFWAGLFMTGLWIIAHECGHYAFSQSKVISDSVGWILHSAVGSPFDHSKGDILGSYVAKETMSDLWEAMGDSPISTLLRGTGVLLFAWPLYLILNLGGQSRYPKWTNHFNPSAAIFKPHQFWQIIWSNVGIALWAAGLIIWASKCGAWEVLSVYGVPYLWTNHWIVLLTYLQHTDPLLPHCRGPEFTFTRGALATFDRSFLGDCGKIMAWIGAHATHGICENHALHHVSSKIPHYNAWEASAALKKFLRSHGIRSDGPPVDWAEGLRVLMQCKFVEDVGGIVFFKNSQCLAHAKPVFDNIGMNGNVAEFPEEGGPYAFHFGKHFLGTLVFVSFGVYGIMLSVLAM
ncbi:hypothetical protein D9756_010508 [Leucocoprinus leucothites]|uniref:Fatty acid desaturase domain-containing protein n=1 Tax=Leucocoprinus leucothites TaxID=201217 RepID=A0A8H5FTN3_9AGAR|nr:hypothetical protein D9756_010508 [Leucoagaricus leucothites]